MTRFYRCLIQLALAWISIPSYAENSLCTKEEKIIFSCQIQNSTKIASVCGSKSLTRYSGYLQYRFGTQSHIEFVYPPSKVNTQEQFYWGEKHLMDGSFLGELNFIDQGHFYTVNVYDISEKMNDIPGGSQGGDVVVLKKGESKFHQLNCLGSPYGEFYLQGIVRDADELVGAK